MMDWNELKVVARCDGGGCPVAPYDTYYRVQPAGLGLAGHYSLTSNDELADGIHVHNNLYAAVHPDGWLEQYGDELVVISAGRFWDNHDVEGVCVNPNEAVILARIPLADIDIDWPGIG